MKILFLSSSSNPTENQPGAATRLYYKIYTSHVCCVFLFLEVSVISGLHKTYFQHLIMASKKAR